MALILPGQVAHPIPLSDEEVLLSNRVTDFRFDLLERRYAADGRPIPEAVVGELLGVTGGEVSWTYNASVKGGGTIDLERTSQEIDWMTARIRVVAILNDQTETNVGVFIPSAPKSEHYAVGVSVPLEVLDKCSLLDQDVYADPVTGMALPYSLGVGADVMGAIRELIEGIGESAQSIPDDLGLTTSNSMTWDIGTTRLRIVNDLLESVNYFSLWVDGMGQFQVTKYTPPQSRPAQYELLAPFEDGRLFDPEWSQDHDIYSIPNRFVAMTSGDEEEEALVSTAILAPESPYSFESRGRWVTAVATGVEAVDQEALDRYTEWRLALAVSTSRRISIQHPILPDLRVNGNIFFSSDSTTRSLCTVYKTSVVFDPLEFCSSELSEVAEVEIDPEEAP